MARYYKNYYWVKIAKNGLAALQENHADSGKMDEGNTISSKTLWTLSVEEWKGALKTFHVKYKRSRKCAPLI